MSAAVGQQGLVLLVGIMLAVGCTQPRTEVQPSVTPVDASACGPPLAYVEILEVVKQAISITGGDPSSLEEDFRITVRPDGCNYIVLGVRKPETIPQEFAITIDRSGQVRSWPWCCVPEFFVPPLQREDSAEATAATSASAPSL